jgi:transposase
MTSATTSQGKSTAGGTLYVGLELSAREWRLAFSAGMDTAVWQTVIPAGDREAWLRAVARAKARYRLSPTAAVWSCYEAGRDGFWPHRWLAAEGVHNRVIDSSSIEVNRRARHAKTDRLDAAKLVRLLLRVALGERDVWHEVHVLTPEAEAMRHAPRSLTMITQERTRWRNRIHSLLATVGVRVPLTARFPARLETARTWDGLPVPAALQARVQLAWRLLQHVETERTALRRAARAAQRAAATPAAQQVQQLTQLRAIGDRFAWMLATEVCCRDVRNRRQVGALTGFTAVPYRSGTIAHDQGISRAGLVQLRAQAVETAWVWVQWQPDSELTRWYQQRFGSGGPGTRRLGIVALARRLVIALWRYSQDGVVPPGAVFKTGVA